KSLQSKIPEKSVDITSDQIETEWQNFKQKFRKNNAMLNYDESKRRQIFADNYRRIRDHNKEADKGVHTYRLGVNQFTDMTQHEFTNGLCGHRT
ncbi:unnamed protein product, partial [Medioppia subpectinata]